ncbi:hypothetical protein [Bacillus sp. 445_BSPC]|uniref:hypothetical protein n=1 Tax=Bacillus sp. 445_BSPC TaxID=1581712 RepID=UPI0006629848|nr:hypothetical protein [Bacillus sp. 445_BSPC]
MNQQYKSEQIIHSESCRSSLLFFWLPTKFKITNRRIMVESKNTVFGFLPIGHRSENITLRNIASVKSSSKIHVIRLLLGLWLFTGSFRLMLSPELFTLGVIELITGFLLLCHCSKSKLKIISNSGQSTEIEVPFIESKKINKVTREVNNQIINF